MNIPVITKNVIRTIHTETQTKKGRIQRWENVEKSFSVIEPAMLKGKHILLVDDVITTGATIEACGSRNFKNRRRSVEYCFIGNCNKNNICIINNKTYF